MKIDNFNCKCKITYFLLKLKIKISYQSVFIFFQILNIETNQCSLLTHVQEQISDNISRRLKDVFMYCFKMLIWLRLVGDWFIIF